MELRQDGYDPGATDGRTYSLNDMVKAGCGGCEGCSACCRGMGSSIVLNPLDCMRICAGLGTSFERLLAEGKIELNVDGGLILPNLKMRQEDDSCGFLDGGGRCGIHPFRPGICRIFPLGRSYEGDSIRYIFLVNGCRKENRTKVKVRKWIDTPDIEADERFLIRWHRLCKLARERIRAAGNGETAKAVSMYVLKRFYMEPFGPETGFYEEARERMGRAFAELGITAGEMTGKTD